MNWKFWKRDELNGEEERCLNNPECMDQLMARVRLAYHKWCWEQSESAVCEEYKGEGE